MTRFACKSYYDDDAQDKRWAVERQDGNVFRILQRCFITQEGAQVWLDRYILIKKQKPESQHLRDTKRRANARRHDPRRQPTASHQLSIQPPLYTIPPPTPPLYRTSWEIISSCRNTMVTSVATFFYDCIHATPACLGLRGGAGWKQHHLTVGLWYSNPVALDVCMSWCCCAPCLINNMHQMITKQKDANRAPRNELCCGWLNPGMCCVCCCMCNRRRIVRHYQVNESCAQTLCYSCCCPCCACCQEIHEVSVREGNLGKPCTFCCCTRCVWAGKAKGSRYANRSTIGSRVGRRSSYNNNNNNNNNNNHAADDNRVVSFYPPPQEVVATRSIYTVEKQPATNYTYDNVRMLTLNEPKNKNRPPHYLSNSFRAVATADHSLKFHPRLHRVLQIKHGWSLDLAPKVPDNRNNERPSR